MNAILPSTRRPQKLSQQAFTLIEVMIVVGIIAILAAIAIPSYRDYIIRGQLVDGTTLLSSMRADMERHFQDNRTYETVTVGSTTFTSPCKDVITKRKLGKFTVSCSGATDLTPSTYLLTATGSDGVAAFSYQVNHLNGKKTLTAPSDWLGSNSGTTWCIKKGCAS